MIRLLSVFLFLNICIGYSQKNSLDIRPVNRFSNLKYLAVHGEKIQEFSYSESVIRAEKNHYAIAMTIHGHQRKFTFPFTKEDLNGKDSLNSGLTEAFYAEKITYHLDDKEYILYKHIDYNCYDPLCGSKHGHRTMITGSSYFSPDYGLLFISQNNNMTLEILTSINGKEAPKDLIIAILKDNQVDNRIIKEYKKVKL
ncbi:hypothetical protein [Flavobacterium sp.]|uniref:hypothetical protein n=1 Tax=Flavobacterium sp. TaxID=239 RepID=UPI0026318FA6|nr:hypothetical protein [Flavobacterium sp.]